MLQRTNYIICFFFLGVSMLGFSQQDSIAEAYIAQKNKQELQQEQKELNFQKFFFQALQHKAIGNFDKAISSLELCQNIRQDDKAVQFELGKNYFELEKYVEAESFTSKALDKEPKNLFILLLLKEIYNKQNNFKAALAIQQKIVEINNGSQLDLVILYIKNNQIEDAKKLLIDLEKKGALDANLIPFKESLLKGVVVGSPNADTNKTIESQTIVELKKSYEKNKSYGILKQILIKLNAKKQYIDLEKESRSGVVLFPAQPFVYLMNGSALNQMKQYKKALNILQSGIDYVIDDPMLEADFQEELSLSYKGLGQNTKASNAYNKAVALRQKKS